MSKLGAPLPAKLGPSINVNSVQICGVHDLCLINYKLVMFKLTAAYPRVYRI